MDLPTCPTCGQSVLDEDEVDCPFCGAPLKGGKAPKGGIPRKAPPKIVPRNVPVVQTPAEPAAKPAGTPAPGPKSLPAITGSKAAPAADEDPFAVDQSQHAGALPVQPRKTAGKTLEVVCPMCETHGFVPQSAVGKQVRCCNPKCLVPVFEVPVPKKEVPPPPPPPPKPIGKWIAGGVVVLAAVGAIYFWWLHRDDLTKPLRTDPITVSGRKRSDAKEEGPKNPEDVKVAEKVKTPAELQTEALAKLIELAQSRDNNRKPTCRRLSATSAITLNDFTQGQSELKQLARVAPLAPYEAVPPLTLLAWKHWKAGDKDKFQATVTDAVQAARKLPERGRHAAQSAIALAAVLSLAERDKDGHELVKTRQKGEPLDDLAALFEIVQQDGSFNLDRTFPGQATGRWERPLSSAVTYLLMLHGQREAARRWAESDPDELAKTESILLWATLVAQAAEGKEGDLAQAAEAVGKLSPSAQACYHARLAEMQRLQKNQAAASQSLAAAQKLLTGAAPQPMRLSTIKEMLTLEEPANKAVIIAEARGAAELAFVQAAFGPTQSVAAGKSLNLALSQLRSLAPSVEAVRAVEQSLLKDGDPKAQQELRQLFSLENADEARRKLIEFNRASLRLSTAAQFRFQLQSQLLLAALDHGMLDAVTQEIESHVAAAEPNEHEAYLETAIPQLLAQKFAAAGKADRQQALLKLIGDAKPKPENVAPLIAETAAQLVAAGKVTEAAAELNPHLRDNGTLHLESLRLACRLTKAGKFESLTREFLGALGAVKEQELREDGLRLTAALAVLGHQEKAVLKAAESEIDRHAVAASLYSGLIEGLARRPVPPEVPAAKEGPAGKKATAAEVKAAGKGK